MSSVIDYAGLIREGLLTTILVTVLGILVAIAVAFLAGLARLSRHWILRAPAYVFIEFFRGTSMIVQLFWVFYALPQLGFELTPLAAGVLVLGLNEGAYAAEIVRGTIASRPRGQTEAAIALNMPPALRMWRILIPQSIPAMLPSFGNVFVDLLKATSLVSFITVADLTFNAQSIRSAVGGDTLPIFMTILVLYFVLSLLLALLTWWLERRFALERRPGGRSFLRQMSIGRGAMPT